jgi:selenocysteine lyase/cysteine desulfurase
VRYPLYLDHARFGIPSHAVRATLDSLAAFYAHEGLSARFDDLLVNGCERWPAADRSLLPGLSLWRGIAELKATLSRVLLGPVPAKVFLAGRTAQLMRAAARLLARRCERVLATDLEWPAYLAILEDELERAGRSLARVPLLRSLLFEKLTAAEVACLIAEAYLQGSCDGLFLGAVGHLGLRLPVATVVTILRRDGHRPGLTLVDASQAFCHLPSDPALSDSADILIAGSHKWPGSLLPLGIMAVTSERVAEELLVPETVTPTRLDPGDPLAAFLERLEAGKPEPFAETVNLTPLFTARAAMDRHQVQGRVRERSGIRLKNVATVSEIASGSGWTPLAVQASVRSGIVLLRARGRETIEAPADVVRKRFLGRGIVLSSYEGGWIRLSMPETRLDARERNLLRGALRDPAWDRRPKTAYRSQTRLGALGQATPPTHHPASNVVRAVG